MTEDTRSHWGSLETVSGSLTSGLQAIEPLLPGLTVLCHPEVDRIGERALLGLGGAESAARLSRLEPLFSAIGSNRRQPLVDPRLSRKPLQLIAGEEGGVRIVDPGGRLRVEVDGQPLEGERVCSAAELERGIVLLLARRVALLLHPMEVLPAAVPRFGLVGQSAAIHSVRRQIERVADLPMACLVRGESGTGKELVAAAIHQGSKRRNGRFEAVSMAALPASLAAAELFGAEKGAFTGADRHRPGLFARTDGGTLFLDEIGETPPEVQALLLRALETGRIRSVGGEREHEVDVRLVAATDADLEKAIDEGRFRGPLYHRLAGYELHVPPLRQRLDDLGLLLLHFLRQELTASDEPSGAAGGASPRGEISLPRPWPSAPLVAELALLDWPGNVRQLRNVVRQLLIASRGESRLLMPPDLRERLARDRRAPLEPVPSAKTGAGSAAGGSPNRTANAGVPIPGVPSAGAASAGAASERPRPEPPAARSYRSPSEVDEQELLDALRAHAFKIQPTAAALGLSRTSLYALIDRSERIRKAHDLERAEIEKAAEEHAHDLDAMAAALEVSRKGLRRRMTRLGIPGPDG